jgi:20S proteasome alpha/beta subunit
VTIAAGLLCQDGFVICADTEETITNERKYKTDKITLVQEYGSQSINARYTFPAVASVTPQVDSNEQKHHWSIAVTGSGHSDWVQAYTQGMSRDVFSKISEKPTCAAFESLLKDYTQYFFDKYLKNYAENPDQRPQVCMLIALMFSHVGGGREIYRINDNLVIKGEWHTHVSVGAGAPMFQHLADDLIKGSLRMKQSASIAAYIMNRVKADVPGCGGNTHMVMLGNDGNVETIPTRRIKELEIHHADIELRLYENFAAKLMKELP